VPYGWVGALRPLVGYEALNVSAVVATIHLYPPRGHPMSQEQENLSEMIYALNETMVGKFDALNARVDRLESTLTDDALALSGVQEALIMGLQQQLQPEPAELSDWFNEPINWMVMHVYTMLWQLSTQNGLDPLTLTRNVGDFIQDQLREKEQAKE